MRALDIRTKRGTKTILGALAMLAGSAGPSARAQAPKPTTASTKQEKVIIDTDIGDDIDDAFALALALHSPELQILGVTTTFGDTELRAKLARRLLDAAGRQDIPVFAGAPTQTTSVFPQRRYAESGPFDKASQANAVDFLL